METFVRDLAWAWRVARANRGATAIVALTLALGIGATITMFSVVDAWLLRPLNFPDPDRLVIGFAANRQRPTEPAVFLPYRSYLAWKERSRSFEAVSAAMLRSYLVSGSGDASTALGLAVTPEFFEVLGVPATRGRTLSARDANGPAAAVISHGLWERRFGASDAVIGTQITLNGAPHEIAGVMARDFDMRMLDQARSFEVWTLFGRNESMYVPDGIGPIAVVGRLRGGMTVAGAQAEVEAIQHETEQRYPQNFNQFAVLLTPLQADNTRTVRATLLTVSGAVACLLLIACINVSALQLGRGFGRAREAAIRAALGSGRGRLLRQYLTESLLLSVVGGGGGLLVAMAAIGLFAAWDPLGTLPPRPIAIDARVFGFATAVMVGAAALCGLLPALRFAAADPAAMLRAGGERGSAGPRSQRVQAMLLTAQIAVSVVLIVVTTLFVRTFVGLQSAPLGFEPANLTVAGVSLPNDEYDTPSKRLAFYRLIRTRLMAAPGVDGAAAGTSPPLSSGPVVSVRHSSDDDRSAIRISSQEVTDEFFDTAGIPVLAGRAFEARDSAEAPPVVVLNDRAATTLFGSTAHAVGRRIHASAKWWDVVGVVGSTRSVFFNTMEWVTNPIVYFSASQTFGKANDPTVRTFGFHLHVRARRPLSMAEIKAAAASVSAGVAVNEVSSGREAVAKATRQPAVRMALVGWFAGASLLLAAIGVYGLVSQAVAQRRREIGVRLALGAKVDHVVRVVAGRAMVAGTIGAVCGCVGAAAAGSRLQALLYGVRATDAASFVTAACALLAVTGMAALLPALRASRINPTDVLRGE